MGRFWWCICILGVHGTAAKVDMSLMSALFENVLFLEASPLNMLRKHESPMS